LQAVCLNFFSCLQNPLSILHNPYQNLCNPCLSPVSVRDFVEERQCVDKPLQLNAQLSVYAFNLLFIESNEGMFFYWMNRWLMFQWTSMFFFFGKKIWEDERWLVYFWKEPLPLTAEGNYFARKKKKHWWMCIFWWMWMWLIFW
jgi:hypothetical protein